LKIKRLDKGIKAGFAQLIEQNKVQIFVLHVSMYNGKKEK